MEEQKGKRRTSTVAYSSSKSTRTGNEMKWHQKFRFSSNKDTGTLYVQRFTFYFEDYFLFKINRLTWNMIKENFLSFPSTVTNAVQLMIYSGVGHRSAFRRSVGQSLVLPHKHDRTFQPSTNPNFQAPFSSLLPLLLLGYLLNGSTGPHNDLILMNLNWVYISGFTRDVLPIYNFRMVQD